MTKDESDRMQNAVYFDDLRNRMIHVGDCSMKETSVSDEHKVLQEAILRLETEVDSHERESTRIITDLTTSFRYIQQMLEGQQKMVENLDRRMDDMERKLDRYNDLRVRVDDTEACMKALGTNFVPRSEFNGALSSVREYAKQKADGTRGRLAMLVWAIGIGFTAMGGTLGFIAARVFG